MTPKIAPWRPIVNCARAMMILMIVASLSSTGCRSSRPHPGDLYLHEATAARERGDLEEARQKARLAIEDGRREREAREFLASIYRNQARSAQEDGDLIAASELFFEAAHIEPSRRRQEHDYRSALAAAENSAQLSERQYLETLERVIEALPGDSDLHFKAARQADDLGDAEKALDHYLWLLSADPDNSQIALRTGINFLSAGRPKDAAAVLKRLYQQEPENFQAAINLVSALQELGEIDEIRALFELLVERFPDQPGLLFRFANFEADQGNHAQAQQLRQQAQQASPAIEEREDLRPLR